MGERNSPGGTPYTRRLRTKDIFFFLEAFLQLHVYLNKKSEIFSDISRFSGLAMSRKSSYQSLPDEYSYIKRE